MAVRSADVVGRTSHVGRIGALAVAIGLGLATPLDSGIAWASPVELDSFSTEPEPTADTLDDGVGDAPEPASDEPTSPPAASPSEQETSTADPEQTREGGTSGESVTAKTVEVAPGVVISSSGGAQTSSDDDAEPSASAEPTPEAAPPAAPADDPPAPVAPPPPRLHIDRVDRIDHGGHGYEGLDHGSAPSPPAVQDTGRAVTRISVTAVPDIEPALGDTVRTSSLFDQPQWAGMSTSEVTGATGVSRATDAPEPQSSALKRVGLIVGVLGLFGVTPGTPATPGGGVAPVLQLAWAWRRDAARGANTASIPTPARPLTNGATNGSAHGAVTFVDGSWSYVPTAHALHAAAATDAPTATTTDTFTVSIVEGSGVTTEVPINISLLSPISAATAEVHRIPVGNGPGNIAVGLDGRYVYVPHAMESTLGVLDSWTGSVTYLDTAAPVGRAELTADGSRLYAANGSNGTMTVVDTETNSVVSTVAVGGYASDFVLDTTGDRACVLVNPPDGGFDLVVIDTATDTVVGRAHLGPDADLPVISPDGGTLFIRDSIGRSIRAVDTATFSSTEISADWHVTHLAVGPDGRHLFASTIPDLHVYDTETKALVRTLADLGGARFLVFSPDGSTLYTANLDGDTLAVIDTATFAHETVKVGSHPVNAAVSTDGRQLFLLNGDGTVSVLDTVTEGADTVDIHGRSNDLFQIALSPDGRHVYIPQYETGTLAVVSARTANLAPTVDVDQVDEPGSSAVTYTVSGVDADGDELVYTVVPLAPGALTDLGGGRFRFVPDTALSGHLPPGVHDALSVTVSDGHGGSRAVRGTYVVAPYAEATVVDTWAVGGEVRSVAVSPDGSTAYIPIIDPGGRSRVEVLDTASGDLLAIVALADDPRGIASLNTDGSRLVVPGGEYVMIIDTTTFEVIAALEGADHAVLDPDGLKAYTLRPDEMSIHDVNPGSAGFGTRIGAVPTGGHAEGMATGPDGRVYFATSDFVVTAVDTATDMVVATISTTSGSHNLTAAPGRLYAPLHGTSLAILDTDAAVVAANIPIRVESPGAYVTANTDGSRIYLSRREEGILSVFDPATNTIIASVRVGDGAVAPAAVSADGSLVAVPVGDSVTIVATGRNIEV